MPRLREDEAVLAPPALRGCAGQRAGKQVRKSPAAIGNAAWMGFLEVFSPEELGRSSAGVGGLAPGTFPPVTRCRRGREPTGLGAIHPSPTCQREGSPSQPSRSPNGSLPGQTLGYICSSSSSIFTPHLPAPRACSPGGFGECKGGTAKRCKSQNSLWSRGRHSRHRPAAVLGSQPCWAGFQAKRGREKAPFK